MQSNKQQVHKKLSISVVAGLFSSSSTPLRNAKKSTKARHRRLLLFLSSTSFNATRTNNKSV